MLELLDASGREVFMDRKRNLGVRMTAIFAVGLLLGTILNAGKVLDERARPDAILDAVAHDLDVRGIDVVRGNTAALILGERPRVTRLVGMPTGRPAGTYVNSPWM